MGLLYSFVGASKAGGAQFDWVYSAPQALAYGNAAWPAANTAILARFRVAKPLTLTKTSILNGTPSGNVDGGLYTSTDDGETLTRLASSGSVASAGTSVFQDLTWTAAVVVVPGIDYWMAVAADNATITVARVAGAAGAVIDHNVHVSEATSFPLPTTITDPAAQTVIPFMRVS